MCSRSTHLLDLLNPLMKKNQMEKVKGYQKFAIVCSALTVIIDIVLLYLTFLTYCLSPISTYDQLF